MAKYFGFILMLSLMLLVACDVAEETYVVPVATSVSTVAPTPTLALSQGGQYLTEGEKFSVGVGATTYENLHWSWEGKPGVYGSALLGTAECHGLYALYVLDTVYGATVCDVAIVTFYTYGDQIQAFPNLSANVTVLKELQ
jgi:hypothetical protein